MFTSPVYVCNRCFSPRIEYHDYVSVKGISMKDGAEIRDAGYLEESDYCYDCEFDTRFTYARLVLHNDRLYILAEDDYSIETHLLTVPHRVEGDNIYFEGKPILLATFKENEIIKEIIDAFKYASDPEEKRHAFETLLNIAGSGCKS